MGSGDFNYGHGAKNAGRDLDVDSFIKNRTRGAFDDNLITEKHLKDAGSLTLWLHAKAAINVRWCHQWWKRIQVDDKQTGRKEWRCFFTRINSHERDDQVLINQYRRKKGQRVYAPEDAFGKLCESIYQAVRAGSLSWVEPLVRFDSDRRDEIKIVRAGDFYGGFGDRDLDDDQLEELKAAGVFVKDAWKQSLSASARYAFCVVNEDDVGGGNKVFDVNDGIGRRWQRAIEGAIADFGPEKGNPKKTPYPFKVAYDENAKGADKYAVRALVGKAATSEMLDLIREEDPADVSDLVALYDPDELRASIEAHAVAPKILLPLLDASFPVRDPSRARAAEKPPADKPREEPKPAAREPLYSCDACDADRDAKTLAAEDEACPKCGARYDLAADPAALLTRRCMTAECGEQMQLPAPGAEAACGKCGAVHAVVPGADGEPLAGPEGWKLVRPAPAKEPEKAAAAEATPPLVGRRGGKKKAADAPAS